MVSATDDTVPPEVHAALDDAVVRASEALAERTSGVRSPQERFRRLVVTRMSELVGYLQQGRPVGIANDVFNEGLVPAREIIVEAVTKTVPLLLTGAKEGEAHADALVVIARYASGEMERLKRPADFSLAASA